MRTRTTSLLATLLLLACAGHGSSAVDPPADGSASAPPAATLAFDCDGFEFTAQVREQTARILLPGRSLDLRHVPAGSGAKYSDGASVFWSEGDEALLELETARYPGCRLNPARSAWEAARLRGVVFRGLGNEPGWSVEVGPDDRIVMLTDYGRTRVELSLAGPPPAPPARTTLRAHGAEHELVLTIEAGGCRDDMSGEAFESRVIAVLDARELRGCGRWLADPPRTRREE